MKRTVNNPVNNSLRHQAEELWESNFNATPPFSENDAFKLIHELQVHQIELELLNDEHIKAKQEAEAATEKYAYLFDFAPSGYISLSREVEIVNINIKGAEMLGKNRASIKYKIFYNFISSDSKPVFIDFIENVFKYNGIVTSEITLLQGNQPIHVFLTGIAEDNEEQCLINMVDITLRKQMENDLVKARKLAEENDRLKTAFLANISHEIRTPMSGILGFADLLKIPNLSGESQAMYLEAIISSGNRMLDIITDLMNISKIEAGETVIKKDVTNINKLIDELFIFFLPEANKKGIDLIINNELPVDKILVETDKTKLTQVITNLIKNALKFTNDGSIEFGCRMKDNFLHFYVKDTGIGIKKEYQELIFERFKQGEVSTSGISEGVGLGLSISKAFVEILGGTIWVNSGLSKGSDFNFTIPFKEPVVNATSTKKEEKTVKTSQANILIAEDEEFIYFYLDEVLKLNNMKAIHAINGEEAINIVKNNPNIDLILMDGQMPVMDGLEATRQITKIRPEIPIIALSAMTHDSDIENALKAGCVDYLTKPVNSKALLNKISSYLISKPL